MKFYAIFFFGLFFVFQVDAQSREELRVKQKRIEQELNSLSNLVSQTGKDVKQNLIKLQLLEKQIFAQGELISNLQQQNDKTSSQIQFHLDEKQNLEDRFNQLKEEYAKVLMSYYKTRNAYNDWMFILAAENFNAIYKRFVYLHQYGDYRKSQASEIKETEGLLQVVIDSIEIEKLEQERLISLENDKLEELNTLKENRLVLLAEIRDKQAELQSQLNMVAAKEKAVKTEVMKYIMEERSERVQKEKIVEAASGNNKYKLLNTVFESAKGKLNWPVENGIIVKRFGVYHPANMSQITLRNDGVDIQTDLGADVKAVFKGEVVKIVNIPGANAAVLVQHGDYYMLYTNLKYLNVKVGSKLEIGQLLGKVYGESTEDRMAILNFQIWKNQEKLNPEKWLNTGKI